MREIPVVFYRHGQTRGNLERRYVGRTDEPLCPEGVAALLRAEPPAAEALYVSPLRRCRESAALLYPALKPVAAPGLAECDFGEFEMKNYPELNGNPAYQAWIDSGGELPFPGGESRAAFQDRCCRAFADLAAALVGPDAPADAPASAAFVVHGGTIMAVLSRFGLPARGYFDWQVKNGEGYAALLDWQDGAPRLREIRRAGRTGEDAAREG